MTFILHHLAGFHPALVSSAWERFSPALQNPFHKLLIKLMNRFLGPETDIILYEMQVLMEEILIKKEITREEKR